MVYIGAFSVVLALFFVCFLFGSFFAHALEREQCADGSAVYEAGGTSIAFGRQGCEIGSAQRFRQEQVRGMTGCVLLNVYPRITGVNIQRQTGVGEIERPKLKDCRPTNHFVPFDLMTFVVL